ncbi:hypothetical protein F5Y02DRAFT_397692 [Annulohypoxylon stygium]|nr:hypothetical protein F5Y02DRAFT_397692 [Annulohypoxylon stygium]
MSSRNTRARSRANAGNTYSEPPSADLPSLYPVHDGSYGVNTHANLENVRRRGRKPTSDVVNEDDEDRRFTRRMRGRDSGRFNMENDLQRVAEETVEEARKGDGTSEDLSIDTQQPDPATNPTQLIYQAVSGHDEDHDGIMGNEPSQPAGPQEPYIPTLSGRKFFPTPDTKGTPPHNKTHYRSADPDSLIHNRRPLVPLTNPTPFFGSPNGTGYVDDNASQSPGSVKSFKGESTLYGNASVYTPRPRGTSQPQETPQSQNTFKPTNLFQSRGTSQPPGTSAPTAPTAPTVPTSGPVQYKPGWGPSVYQEPNLSQQPELQQPSQQPSSQQPTYQQSTYNQPTFEEVPNEQPVHETPTYEQPAYEQPTYQQPQQPPYQQPTYQQPPSQLISTKPVQSPNNYPGMEKANANPDRSSSFGKSGSANIDSSGNPVPGGLTQAQREEIENFRLGMLLPPAPESLGPGPSRPQGFAGQLSPEEIQLQRDFVRDMFPHPTMSRSTFEELDKAANRASLQPTTMSTNQPQPPVEEIKPANNSLLTPDSNTEYTDASRATDRSSRPTLETTIPVSPDEPTSDRPSRRKRVSWTRWIADKWDAIFFFLTILTGVWVALTFLNRDSAPVRGDILDRPEWLQWGTVRDGILQYIPSVPSVPSVPSGVKNPLGSFWDSISTPARTSAHAGTGMLVEDIVEDLGSKLPEVVVVNKDKHGKLKISQDFWHALKARMKEDDVILTLNEAARDGATISDAHWRAIENRLRTSEFLKSVNSTGGNTDLVEYTHHSKQCEECWDRWISNNNDALKRAVSGIALNRTQFLELFKAETKSRSQEVDNALKNANDRIDQLRQDIDKVRDTAPTSTDLPKAEIKKICDAAIAKAIKDIKMGAIAEGQIRGHAQDLFANQVNFFGHGSGAVVDPTYSSKPWQIPWGFYKYKSKEWFQRDGWKTQPVKQALAPWFEEGECFCAGPKSRGQRQETVSVHVMMSRDVIPQNLVVEHILPGSTLDPGARPREIEVWANIDEITLREEVKVFSQANFPTTEPEKTLNEAYVKVGHFVYEDVTTGDGVQIFKFSDELIRMNAYTPSIVVRTISNYGADHTCFYRLKLYGEVVEVERWNK